MAKRDSSKLSTARLYDPHCHVFNVNYLLLEIWEMIAYFHQTEKKEFDDFKTYNGSVTDPLKGETAHKGVHLKSLFKWLAGALSAAFADESGNFKTLQDAGKRAWKTPSLNIIPLMMDIYYMFHPPLLSISNREANNVSGNGSPDSISPDTRDQLPLHFNQKDLPFRTRFYKGYRLFFKTLLDEFQKSDQDKNPEGFEDVQLSPGFRHHLVKLINLKKQNPDRVFPFLAVDPRRPGIVEAATNPSIVSKQGYFQGIKLYPRFGVHPECPELEPVFDYCHKNHIPILTHGSPLGFPAGYENYQDYGDPANFESVLKKYDGIKINIAHFAGNVEAVGPQKEKSDRWALTIVELMKRYPGVYSDLACYSTKKSMKEFYAKHYSDSTVRARTMFGTDFNVMYFTNIGKINLVKYFKRFKKFFGEDVILNMAGTIPREYLGL